MTTSGAHQVRKIPYRIDRRVWMGSVILGGLALLLTVFSPVWSSVAWMFFVLHFLFFRDPGFSLCTMIHPISPAYGTVSDIEVVSEKKFIQGPALRIGISLSLFVPHVQRVPVSGMVEFQEYVPGAFKNALEVPKAQANESNWVGIRSENYKVLVRQMAGMMARKIYSDVALRQSVIQGEKLGVICYGSRVECFLPEKDFKVWVRVGDQLKGGQTQLGEWIL